jgi:hypothetical protein
MVFLSLPSIINPLQCLTNSAKSSPKLSQIADPMTKFVVFKFKIFMKYEDVFVHTVNTYKGKRGIASLVLKNEKKILKIFKSLED